MMRVSAMVFGAFLCAGVAGSFPTAVAAQAPAWTTLFDGWSLDQFNEIGSADWTLAARVVEARQGNGYLVTKESYGDFDLRVEFWATDDANSGIFIRCANPRDITAASCYEVNIFDKRPDQTYRTGAIVNVAKPSAVVDTGGKWNTMEITARGPRMTVAVNGQMLVDAQDSAHARGPIALQYGAGTVRFRKVEIRPAQ
jgi:hypothetical protein